MSPNSSSWSQPEDVPSWGEAQPEGGLSWGEVEGGGWVPNDGIEEEGWGTPPADWNTPIPDWGRADDTPAGDLGADASAGDLGADASSGDLGAEVAAPTSRGPDFVWSSTRQRPAPNSTVPCFCEIYTRPNPAGADIYLHIEGPEIAFNPEERKWVEAVTVSVASFVLQARLNRRHRFASLAL